MILWVAFAIGLLSGFLDVSGGFINMPALFYLVGVPVPVAVGTDFFEIVFSGGLKSFLYAVNDAVDLPIVLPLLARSAFGTWIGSAATSIVDDDDIKIYFGLVLLGGALAVAIREIGTVYDLPILNHVGLTLVLGSALLVSGVSSTAASLRCAMSTEPPRLVCNETHTIKLEEDELMKEQPIDVITLYIECLEVSNDELTIEHQAKMPN